MVRALACLIVLGIALPAVATAGGARKGRPTKGTTPGDRPPAHIVPPPVPRAVGSLGAHRTSIRPRSRRLDTSRWVDIDPDGGLVGAGWGGWGDGNALSDAGWSKAFRGSQTRIELDAAALGMHLAVGDAVREAVSLADDVVERGGSARSIMVHDGRSSLRKTASYGASSVLKVANGQGFVHGEVLYASGRRSAITVSVGASKATITRMFSLKTAQGTRRRWVVQTETVLADGRHQIDVVERDQAAGSEDVVTTDVSRQVLPPASRAFRRLGSAGPTR